MYGLKWVVLIHHRCGPKEKITVQIYCTPHRIREMHVDALGQKSKAAISSLESNTGKAIVICASNVSTFHGFINLRG